MGTNGCIDDSSPMTLGRGVMFSQAQTHKKTRSLDPNVEHIGRADVVYSVY